MATKLSTWNILGKLKLEIAFILLCIMFTLNIPLSIVAISNSSYKQIFLGLDVELPPLTIYVFRLSDMLSAWWFIAFPVMLIALLTCAFVLIKFLMKITGKDPEGDSAAKFQIFTIAACSIIIVVLLLIQNVAQNAMLSPLLRLVNSS